jgi:hypothetical protein
MQWMWHRLDAGEWASTPHCKLFTPQETPRAPPLLRVWML